MSDASVKSLFLSISEIAALHPQVVELQAEIGDARPLGASRSKAMQAIIDESDEVDVVHDALVRAVQSGVETDRLCSLARKPPDRARARLPLRGRAPGARRARPRRPIEGLRDRRSV